MYYTAHDWAFLRVPLLPLETAFNMVDVIFQNSASVAYEAGGRY